MIKKLKEIAEIQFGFNKNPKDEGKSGYEYILSSHFDEDYQLEKNEDSFVEIDDKSSRYLLKENDIILAGKGQRIFSWPYKLSYGNIVPSSLFYIIKTNSDEIIGEYLACYLNSKNVLHKLNLIGAGSSITSIPKKELLQINIVIPSIEEQNRIIETANLLDKNIKLHLEIIEKNKDLKQGLINKMINN
jgi:restriction endonuclease S subunit